MRFSNPEYVHDLSVIYFSLSGTESEGDVFDKIENSESDLVKAVCSEFGILTVFSDLHDVQHLIE